VRYRNVKINQRTVAVRASCASLVVLIGLLIAPVAGQAQVSGGCTASATASKSGPADLTTATVWHVTSADVLNGQASSSTPQRFAQLKVVFFGIGLPLLDRKGNATSGPAGPYRIADYDRYTRVLAVAGTSTTCEGAVLIVVDDVAPLATWAGVLGLIAGLLGLIGLVASMFLVPTGSSRVVGMILGLLGGLGAGVYLQQAAILDPANVLGLALPGVGVVLGLLLPGTLHERGASRPAA
jgi:hypothetical protein